MSEKQRSELGTLYLELNSLEGELECARKNGLDETIYECMLDIQTVERDIKVLQDELERGQD